MPPMLSRCSGGSGSEFHRPAPGAPWPPESAADLVVPASQAFAEESRWPPSAQRAGPSFLHSLGDGTRRGETCGISYQTLLASALAFHARHRQLEHTDRKSAV